MRYALEENLHWKTSSGSKPTRTSHQTKDKLNLRVFISSGGNSNKVAKYKSLATLHLLQNTRRSGSVFPRRAAGSGAALGHVHSTQTIMRQLTLTTTSRFCPRFRPSTLAVFFFFFFFLLSLAVEKETHLSSRLCVIPKDRSCCPILSQLVIGRRVMQDPVGEIIQPKNINLACPKATFFSHWYNRYIRVKRRFC